jgi:hypothetical protein
LDSEDFLPRVRDDRWPHPKIEEGSDDEDEEDDTNLPQYRSGRAEKINMN